MVSWQATVSWPGPGVGCFDPAMVLHQLRESFGVDLEFREEDLLVGHYERVAQTASALGLRSDSSPVLSAAKLIREVSPRYEFRLRVGTAKYVTGHVDRYQVEVRCESMAEFPEPMRSRFVEFLRSLRLGDIKAESTA